MYFLVDGIYPKWSVFVSTISETEPHSKEAYFATCQEAVRKDIERAFGVLVARFEILQKPMLMWSAEKIALVVDACIILHNMIVVERRSEYVSNDYLVDNLERQQQDDGNPGGVINLFGANQHPNDEPGHQENITAGAAVDEIFAARAAKVNEDLRDEAQHNALKFDLIEHIWKSKQARDAAEASLI